VNILVTGGLGLNGVWVVRKLVDSGFEPVVIDNRRDLTLLGEYRDRVRVLEADIMDLDALEEVMRETAAERVVHMAAMTLATEANPVRGFGVNAMGTVNVLEAARRASVERVIFTSSRSFYGDIPEGPHRHPAYLPLPETHRGDPILVYDVTKVAGEGMGRVYARMYDLEFVALRFGTIYGPGKMMRHPGQSLAVHSSIIDNAISGRKTVIPRGGDQADDIIFVEDAANGVVLATLASELSYDAYNIASGEVTSLREFAKIVRSVIPAADIEIGDGLDYLGLPLQPYCRFDITRARADLGFEPGFSVVGAVKRYVELAGDL
jgi:UDP-glucose 4-epimerase